MAEEGVLPVVNPQALAAAGGKELKEVGWTNGLELAILLADNSRRGSNNSGSATVGQTPTKLKSAF